MAGKRQHYIPRFLQRGFLAECNDGGERTWLHRRGAGAKLIGIRDIGVEEYFYSRPSNNGTRTLDDQITEIESSIVVDLENLRNTTVGAGIDGRIAARLVVHLTFRTAHVRSMFNQGAMLVLDHVADYVSNNDWMREELGVDRAHRESERLSLVDMLLTSLPEAMVGLPAELSRRIISFYIRERFDELYEKNKPQLAQALSVLGHRFSKSIKESHRKALEQLDLSAREGALAPFSWRIQSVSGALLPDCIALARESGETYTPYLLGNWESIDCVVLPISHDRLLIGSKEKIENIPISVVNEASANCSDNFFISQRLEHGESMGESIGQRCIQIVTAQVEDAISGLKSTANTDGSFTVCEEANRPNSPCKFNFTLTCKGFGDRGDVAVALGQIIKSIVLEVGRDMPLSELDGVTFAVDYKAALEQLDRGTVDLGIEKSGPRDYGYAVAKCVRVVRDGKPKEHIVFDASIAHGLLREQSEGREIGIHMVVNMLSHVAHGTLFERKFQGVSVASPDDTLGLLHRCIASIPGMYYAARQSAFALPATGERLAELTLDSYKSARETIRSARLAYRLDNDLDGFLELTLPRISYVLEHAAEWLGHRDGLPTQDEFPGMSLIDDLRGFELDHWLELLGRDLHYLYSSEDQFTAENIFALGRHAERLLWTAQIFPWPMSEGRTYVSIPIGDDESELSAL
uniref:hypothetical protein n=1 Tax=Alcaligenes faecalis TaxID=511 RepID=UPI003CFEFB04